MSSIMDDARRRREELDEPYYPTRPGPIEGPRRPLALPSISNTTLAIVGGVLLAALVIALRGLPAPLAVAGDPSATPTQPSIPPKATATLPPASGPGRIAAWWAPGGERTSGDLFLDAISGPIARCATHPGLVQVAIGGEPGPWVEADAAGIDAALLAVLPDAGGPCAPPTATPRPYVAPAPVYAPPPPQPVVATLEAPAGEVQVIEPTSGPPPLPPTPCPVVLTTCQAPLVVAP